MASEEVSQAVEEWRDILGYEGYYQVSSLGHVRGLDRTNSFGRFIKGRDKTVTIGKIGYPVVSLHKDGIGKTCYVHRLVASAFLPNPNNLEEVDHINGDKTDVRLENLRWCTRSQNAIYAIDLGLVDVEEKTRVLKSPEVRAAQRKACIRPVIRSDGKRYDSIMDAADDTGCGKSAVWRVLKGLRKTTHGFGFAYA